mgnify:FL=1
MEHHRRILVVGGTGFIGRQLVAHLASRPQYLKVPTRRRERARWATMLPNCELIGADVHDAATLERLASDVDVVINLVGILHDGRGDPYGAGFARAHVELPRRLAALCARLPRAPRLLHVSALGVRDDGPRLPSMYLRSKADGERAVRDSGCAWTIFRPSVVFGPEDNFLNMFAGLARWLPVLPLARADARFAPVYVRDVAHAIANAIDVRETVGRTYELAGPETWTLGELARFAAGMEGLDRRVVHLPDAIGRLQARMLSLTPGGPLMSIDNFDSLSVPNVPSDPALVFPPELGVKPLPLSAAMQAYGRTTEDLVSERRTRANR